MTTAEAFLRHNPRLGEDYLAGLVADLDARLARVTAALRAEHASDTAIAEVARFYLDRPFEAITTHPRPVEWDWDWWRLVERIGGTPKMQAGLEQVRRRRAAAIAAPTPPAAPSPTRAPTPERTRRVLRDLVAGGRLGATPADQAVCARVMLPVDDDTDIPPVAPLPVQGRRRRSREEIADLAEQKRTRRAALDAALAAAWGDRSPPVRITDPDDPLFGLEDVLDDARIASDLESHWTPARVLTRVMRPATNALTRHRRARRAFDRAAGARESRRAADELNRVEIDPEVKAVLAADLDAERALLRPVIQAALDGSSPRWRHIAGRVVDEKGRDLVPPCLRPWQVL